MSIARRAFIQGAGAAAGAIAAGAPGALMAQAGGAAYPNRTIRIVVAFSPGGILDIGGRLIGEELSRRLNTPVIIDNRPGAGAIVAITNVLSVPADGYTLLFHPISSTSKAFFKTLSFDPLKDLVPVAPVWSINSFFFVNSSLPVKTFAEFISYAKAHPDVLNSGSSFVGGQLWNEALKRAAGIKMTSVPYKGSSAVMPALLSNDIQACVDGVQTYTPFIKEGKVRPLVFLGPKRFEQLSDVPSIAEVGYPQLVAGSSIGFWAKAGTPANVISTLSPVIRQIVALPAISARIASFGAHPETSSNADFHQRVQKETEWWSNAARAANFDPQ